MKMSIIKRAMIAGTILSGFALSNYTLSLLILPENNPQADLTAVFTGSNGRVKEALKTFSKNCTETKQWLLISGAGKRTTLSALLKHNSVALSKACEGRIIIGSYAHNTAGNAHELELTLSVLRQEFDFNVRSVELRTAWCHMPRAMRETKNHLPRDISLSTQYAGSCNLATKKGMKLFLSEIIKLPVAQFKTAETFSKISFSHKGSFRVGRRPL